RAARAGRGGQRPRRDVKSEAGQHDVLPVRLPHPGQLDRDAVRALGRHRHQSSAKVTRTIRKSKTRIRMKLHTTAAVVEAAMPSVPPRVRSPKVQGRIEATMPKTTPFTSPTMKSVKCTHSSMRAK